MSLLSQIALTPYHLYLGLKTLVHQIKGTSLPLKEKDYLQYLRAQDQTLIQKPINNQKIVALLFNEDKQLSKALHQINIDTILTTNGQITSEVQKQLENYSATLFLKKGEKISPYFRCGLP